MNTFLNSNSLSVILLFLDFSKAFDSINHNLLLKKLNIQFYFDCSSIKLLKNYLANRTQYVSMGEQISSSLHTSCGVPQGSVLGPLLFSLYINDIYKSLSYSECRLFADDVQVYLSGYVHNLRNLVGKMNDDLDAISYWSKENYLKINPSKSQAMLIYKQKIITDSLPKIKLNDTVINFVDKAKNLGIMFSSTFTWYDQINMLATRIYPILRKLWKLSPFLSEWAKKKLIIALVLPHYMYCCEVFTGMNVTKLNKLNVMFNDCTRFVCNRKRSYHISDVSKLILGCTFNNYLKFRRIVFFKKILNKTVPDYLVGKITLGRSIRNRTVIIPSHNSSVRHLSYFIATAKLWNTLPNTIKSEASFRKFVILLRNYFNQQS